LSTAGPAAVSTMPSSVKPAWAKARRAPPTRVSADTPNSAAERGSRSIVAAVTALDVAPIGNRSAQACAAGNASVAR
jgi:hypothetical protein